MNVSGNHRYVLLLISTVLVFLSVKVLINSVTDIESRQSSVSVDTTAILGFSDELTKKALNSGLPESDSNVSWEGDSPFRHPGAARYTTKRRKTSATSSFKRERLVLNGTLTKENPLALLEDRRGKTYIKSSGEDVLGRKIISIGEDSVEIKDPLGTEVLYVSKN